jgi:hypothetical protein
MAFARETVSTPGSLPAIPAGAVCQQCGYDLRGLTGAMCPECGRSLAGVRATVSQIPWSHHRDIGRFRAYWKTIWLVMFRQQEFCDELARPVDFVDSQRFRWMTVLHAAAPAAAVIVVTGLLYGDRLRLQWDLPSGGWLMAVLAGFWLHYVLFLLAATGAPSYFFHPKACPIEQQNRAIALSYYASGPLALMFVPALALAIASPLPARYRWDLFLQLLAALLVLAVMAVWWLDLVHLTRRLLPQRPGCAWLVGIFVPSMWYLLALAIFWLLPAVWGYAALAVQGLLL